MTTTCPSAPRRAFGLRLSTLRRMSASKCARILATPTRCDARPLAARWHGEGMTNETTTKQEVLDRIATGAVEKGLDVDLPVLLAPGGVLLANVTPPSWSKTITVPSVKAWLDALLSRAYDAGRAAGRGDEIARAAVATNIATTLCGNELRAALGVTDPWDGCIATVRDLVAKDKARPAPTDAAAEDAAVDELVDEAVRPWTQLDRSAALHHRDGALAIFLGDTPPALARGWLRPWLLAAWARGVAYGQGDISTGESRCAAQLANALGHVSETLPTWEEALAMVTRDRQPTPGDFFGMAAREQVAAERAVDAAAVALSDEDSIRATFVKSEIEGLRNQAEDLDNEVKNLRRSRDSAIAAHKEDQQHAAALREMLGAPADEPWSGILRRARALRNDYVEVAAMATVLRQDIPGRVAAAVAPGEEALAAARDEGRRAGWKEAIAAANRARIVELRAAAKADGEMLRLRNELGAVEERHSQLVLRHEIAAAVLDAVTAAAPKEAP